MRKLTERMKRYRAASRRRYPETCPTNCLPISVRNKTPLLGAPRPLGKQSIGRLSEMLRQSREGLDQRWSRECCPTERWP